MRKPITTRAAAPLRAAVFLASVLVLVGIAGQAIAHQRGHGHDGFGGHDDPAGQIVSFDPDSGTLVIDLAAGGSISGLVTERTWIESDDRCEDRGRRHLHGWCRTRLHHFDHGWHHGPNGSLDDLVPGATVEDALLVLEDGRAFFWKVELDD